MFVHDWSVLCFLQFMAAVAISGVSMECWRKGRDYKLMNHHWQSITLEVKGGKDACWQRRMTEQSVNCLYCKQQAPIWHLAMASGIWHLLIRCETPAPLRVSHSPWGNYLCTTTTTDLHHQSGRNRVNDFVRYLSKTTAVPNPLLTCLHSFPCPSHEAWDWTGECRASSSQVVCGGRVTLFAWRPLQRLSHRLLPLPRP